MKRRFWRWIIVGVIGFAILAYGGVLVWFKANESRLLFFPEQSLESSPQQFGLSYTRVEIPSTDSVTVVGWIIPASTQDSASMWILYLHGNAGNIAKQGYLEHFAALHRLGLNILAIDYRGYGESSGSPTEGGLYQDALASFRYLRTVQHVAQERVVVYGFSLGSAVATDLATRVQVAGLIVEGSFTSITAVGQEHYPFLPVQLMASSHFSSTEKIARVDVPKLFIHARDDHTIPVQHGRELFEIAPEPKTFLEVRGDHNTAHAVDAALFYSGIRLFLMQVQARNRMSALAGEEETADGTRR
jgi:hypothetical protein